MIRRIDSDRWGHENISRTVTLDRLADLIENQNIQFNDNDCRKRTSVSSCSSDCRISAPVTVPLVYAGLSRYRMANDQYTGEIRWRHNDELNTNEAWGLPAMKLP
jgi:hypothetical protein